MSNGDNGEFDEDCRDDYGKRRWDEKRGLWYTELLPGPAAAPTDAEPGSKEKVEVMRMRFENSQALWHPADATRFVRKLNDLEE